MSIQFRKAIVFCTNPLPGCFRFENYFQIYPWTSQHAPMSDKTKLHPVALEYFFDDAEQLRVPMDFEEVQKIISNEIHSNKKQKEILHLISSITNYRFLYPIPEVFWFAPIPNGELKKEELNKQSSQFGIRLFTYPQMGEEQVITKFTEIEHFKFERKRHVDYYTNIDLEGKENVSIPDTFEETIKKYLKLDADALRSVNAATALITQGIDLRTKMKSLSFVAFVSSIETMVDFEYRKMDITFECDQCQTIKESPFKCKKCGRPIWGISAKFKEYLAKYVAASDDARAKINRIYSTRSKIVHTGMLLLGDNYIDWSDETKSENEWQAHLDVMQAARLSVVNWLLMS